MQHLPTVEASIRYWDAISHEAAEDKDPARQQTATALKLTYESARRELLRSGRAHERGPAGPG
jgi:hypothetical protein